MAQNGRIPLSNLHKVRGNTGVTIYLRKDAGLSVERLLAKAGHQTYITDGYRSYEVQVRLRAEWCARGRCQMAAFPGTSNHGWGVAIDCAYSRSDGFARWLHANKALARKHGWVWPAWAARAATYEPWHWEYVAELDQFRNQEVDAAKPQEEDDEMAVQGQRGDHIVDLQRELNLVLARINAVRQRQGGKLLSVSTKKLTVDGHYGEKTRETVFYLLVHVGGKKAHQVNGKSIHSFTLQSLIRRGLDARQAINSLDDLRRLEDFERRITARVDGEA